MRFISVGDLCRKSSEVWRDLPVDREMIVTSNGRPIAILVAVNESNLEESLSAFRQARSVDAVAELQRRAIRLSNSKPSPVEIETEILEVRKQHEH